jgi:hypothetical protein
MTPPFLHPFLFSLSFLSLFANPRGTPPPLLPLPLFSLVHGRGWVPMHHHPAHLKLARTPPSFGLPGLPFLSKSAQAAAHKTLALSVHALDSLPRARRRQANGRRLDRPPPPRKHARRLDLLPGASTPSLAPSVPTLLTPPA